MSAKELAGHRFFLREKGSAARDYFDQYCAREKIRIEPAVESVSTQAIIQCLTGLGGISILSYHIVKAFLSDGTLRQIRIENADLIYHKDIVFVFYFAVRGDLRGKGYGSQILDALKEKFPARRLILTIEDPDAPCENREQRQKRKAFYQKNCFAACGYPMIEKGIAYQALSFGGQVSADELQALLKAYMGGFWYRLYYKF